MTDDRKLRIGFVVIDDYTDDYSDWTGQITFPNPKGANIYWQNPISFIELEPTLQLMKEMCAKLLEAQTDDREMIMDDLGYPGFDGPISIHTKYDEVIEKYRKFLEALHEKN